MANPVTATVTKRFLSVKTTSGHDVTLFEGTELSMEQRPDGNYLASIAAGQQSIASEIVIPGRMAPMWLVFRTREALDYR